MQERIRARAAGTLPHFTPPPLPPDFDVLDYYATELEDYAKAGYEHIDSYGKKGSAIPLRLPKGQERIAASLRTLHGSKIEALVKKVLAMEWPGRPRSWHDKLKCSWLIKDDDVHLYCKTGEDYLYEILDEWYQVFGERGFPKDVRRAQRAWQAKKWAAMDARNARYEEKLKRAEQKKGC